MTRFVAFCISRGEDIQFWNIRAVRLGHEGIIQIAQQLLERVARGHVPEFDRSIMAGRRLHENMPARLMRDVLQQWPQRLAADVSRHKVAVPLPFQGIGPLRARQHSPRRAQARTT